MGTESKIIESYQCTCDIIEKALGIPTKMVESDKGLRIDEGLYVVKQGSAYVMIAVVKHRIRPQILVKIMAQVAACVEPNLALFENLLILNGRLRFGAFSYEPQGKVVLLSHTLLGGSRLDISELVAVIHDVAWAADNYDDRIVARYGGKRMADVVQEQAWEHILADEELPDVDL